MRASILVLAALLSAPASGRGESLQYTAEWRLIHAGDATLTWLSSAADNQARLQLRSAGLISMLLKVNDLYTAEVDENLCAVAAAMNVQEGSRSRETKLTFDASRRKASYVERDLKKNAEIDRREIDVPPCVHEIVGALYRLRSLRVPVGKTVEIPITDGKKSVMGRVEAQQQETVDTPAGRFKAIRYEAYLFNDVLYHRSARLHIWLTDDDRRIPVQVRVRLQFPVGTITLRLAKMGEA